MTDWHSHILPGVDDGSSNVEESLTMLGMLSEQGVDTVVATPHFGANDESATRFLDRRNEAFHTLSRSLNGTEPRILLGAEVRYYPGICRMADIDKLRVSGSKLLLLEMSMERWTEYTIRELVELASSPDIRLMLAHVERYIRFQSKDSMDRLYDNGIMMQVNASFFNEAGTRRKALGMLRSGEIQFIGSDCHNVRSRPPKIGRAAEIIEKKFGSEFLNQMSEYGNAMLDKI